MIIKNDSEIVRAAVQKITDGAKDVKGSKENLVKEAVRDTLCSFCQQSEEFARAVVDQKFGALLEQWQGMFYDLVGISYAEENAESGEKMRAILGRVIEGFAGEVEGGADNG